jgi:transcriptional regulator with XRE-family HTH domain
MSTSYASFLKYTREERHLSQAIVAERIGISRASYIALEKGTKELSLAEAEALTRVFGISIDELLRTETPNLLKYRHMILAFLRVAKEANQVIKKTKLAKLLYLTDFSWYFLTNKSMSGVTYRRIDFGPVADAYFRLLEEMEQDGTVIIKQIYRDDYHMYEIEETKTSSKKSLSLLTKKEVAHIHIIWKQWASASTAEIVKFTHEQKPYQLSLPGELIAYEHIKTEESYNIY